MLWGSSPAAVAARFVAVSQDFLADGPAERADRDRGVVLLHGEPVRVEFFGVSRISDDYGSSGPATEGS